MDKLWTGRFAKQLAPDAEDFNSSIRVDIRLLKYDLRGSIAHAQMLGRQGIIPQNEADSLVAELQKMLSAYEAGTLEIDYTCEDVHTFVEKTLTARLGDAGKRLHTARSRNDQVALDMRLCFRDECEQIADVLAELVRVILEKAKAHTQTVMPGYTHLQRAQPISYAEELLAYAFMFLRDISRLEDCRDRMNLCPLGAAALAGTTYPIDRVFTAHALDFDAPVPNSIDAVSDRDYQVELLSDIALIMMHLSRFSEEIILFCSYEFRFLTLDDGYSTGSSIMPQKKNPDIAELVRGKCGRAYGDLTSLLTILKGLPLAYNKDLQEDKRIVFDAVDTVKTSAAVFAPMLATARVNADKMRRAAEEGFINATDLADYLVSKGLPFRDAYKIVGHIVAYAEKEGKTLSALTVKEFQTFESRFDADVYPAIDIIACMQKRNSEGGTGVGSVEKQLSLAEAMLQGERREN